MYVEQRYGISVVGVKSEMLDEKNSAQLLHTLTSLLNDHKQVVLNLDRVNFVNATGLYAILSCQSLINSFGNRLKLCSASEKLIKLFEISRLHKVFDIYSSCDEAIRSFFTDQEKEQESQYCDASSYF